MKKIYAIAFGLILAAFFASCKSTPQGPESGGIPLAASQTPTPTPTPDGPSGAGVAGGKAYHIKGTIDAATQEGDVCDTSVEFTVPGTLKFKFTPSSPTTGTYTYSGAFNARGSGPYEIYDNGKMKVSGTGCIMGNNCATYSHDWTATPIDAKNCVK